MSNDELATLGKSRHTGLTRRPTAASNFEHPSVQIHAPFNGLEEAQLRTKVEDFLRETGLSLYRQYFLKGAFLAQSDRAFNGPRDDELFLEDDEKISLEVEETKRWTHPRALWNLVVLCAIGAATQGWDESAVDGGKMAMMFSLTSILLYISLTVMHVDGFRL